VEPNAAIPRTATNVGRHLPVDAGTLEVSYASSANAVDEARPVRMVLASCILDEPPRQLVERARIKANSVMTSRQVATYSGGNAFDRRQLRQMLRLAHHHHDIPDRCHCGAVLSLVATLQRMRQRQYRCLTAVGASGVFAQDALQERQHVSHNGTGRIRSTKEIQ